MKDNAYELAEIELRDEAHARKVKTLKHGIQLSEKMGDALQKVNALVREVDATPARELKPVSWPDFHMLQ